MINAIRYVNRQTSKLRLPRDKYKECIQVILPVIIAQILQRLYPIVDNHYIAALGNQALLIHNIQFSFIYFGQYIGAATATSCLIFWKRSEYSTKQKSVFYIHISLCLLISLVCMTIAMYNSNRILSHFSVPTNYMHLANRYLQIGLLNMLLQSVYLSLTGVIIATNKEKLTFIFALALLIFNIFIDSIAINVFFSGQISPHLITVPLLIIGLSNSVLLVGSILLMVRIILRHVTGWHLPNVREILKIWLNELGGAFISGIYPIIYIFQLAVVKTGGGSLLVTYQLLMQLTAIFCIPLLATMQLALRDASSAYGCNEHSIENTSYWLAELLYFGLFPTQVLLFIFVLYPHQLIHTVFNYIPFADHFSYIIIFLIASMIGQIGNALTVHIRAKKNSHLVTTSYFISDVVILLGGMQLIILLHLATTVTAGLVMLVYTCLYTMINAAFALRR